jgi:hypothetical protein
MLTLSVRAIAAVSLAASKKSGSPRMMNKRSFLNFGLLFFFSPF